jgi:DNA repair photolyase
MIYEPKGAAREYADLALNIFIGCEHGCSYCYCPSVLKLTKARFHSPPAPRAGLGKWLANNAWKYSDKTVLLCFACDPYTPAEAGETRAVLNIFNKHNIAANVLTKAGSRAVRDFDLLSQNEKSTFGTTLTFVTESESKKYEPLAASPDARFSTLELAKKHGIATWASIEPVLDADESIECIARTIEFVDEYKIGKLNHVKSHEQSIDWKRFAMRAIALLEKHNKKYYIKNDLRRFV